MEIRICPIDQCNQECMRKSLDESHGEPSYHIDIEDGFIYVVFP